MQITKEQIQKAMACKTAAELVALAKSENIELTEEEAARYISSMAEKKINLDELDDIRGGVCVGNVCGLDC